MNRTNHSNYQPVMAAADYTQVDGQRAYRQEVRELSLGLQELPQDRRVEVVAQVSKGEVGQEGDSESVWPIHRILDAAILLCRSIDYFQEGYRQECLYDPEHPVFDRIPLQGAALSVGFTGDHEDIEQHIQTFQQALEDQGHLIGERLRILSRLLNELGH
ncbi:DUF6530 family protein [Paenibacillus bovis]|uniref:Uncharacterized protein n=1 Tax=Paenibacillus bovis TaxID=1616788 RepID=A0A172ZAN7_9BACL|nr:DUF6530 family protein [Paenibacillus bovis]ANF94694.1 hypothetical protein AR543_00705 [Paenibacillus bovis]